jgi:restriction system protein
MNVFAQFCRPIAMADLSVALNIAAQMEATGMAGRRRKQAVSGPRRMQEAGAKLLVLGAAFLLIPVFLSSSPLGTAFRSLGTLGWMFLGIGAILLGLGIALGRRSTQPPEQANPAAVRTRSRPARRASPDAARPEPASVPRDSGNAEAYQPPTEATQVASPAVPPAAPVRPQSWSKAVFDVIEWRRFDLVVEKLMQQGGFQTRAQSHGADGGVDIWVLSRQDPSTPISLVQCKHWQGKRVGVDKIRELRGVMASQNVSNGQFATTSTFTPDAIEFARANGVGLLDVDALLALIARRTPEQQAELLAVALDGDYWKPTCVNCGVKMTERTPRAGGSWFWGCVNYPGCRTTLAMRAAEQT